MKKGLIVAGAIIALTLQSGFSVFAASTVSGPVSVAIKKYKKGNYTGCLQDMQTIVKRDPSNSLAYYYMAMSYAQAGRKTQAIDAYRKVLSLKTNPTLAKYAETGKRCLESPDKCSETTESSAIDKMIASPYGDGLSTQVRAGIEQKRLEAIKNEINSGKEINNYQLRQFNDNSRRRTEAVKEDKIAQAKIENTVKSDAQPSNDEIVNALRVLQKAGLNPYSQNGTNPLMQSQMMPQNNEMAQLSMMMGNGNNSNNNNSMMNMLPYLMSQQNGQANTMSPQVIQAMMMNSMMPDFTLNTNNDK